MSDDDRDNDIESDHDIPDNGADKRAHHNALERKRRDHIKDSFTSLRDSLPYFQGDKVRASRAQILKKAADYIQSMRRKNSAHQQDIDDLKRQNKALEDQIRTLEKAKTTGNFAAAAAVIEHCNNANSKVALGSYDPETESEDSSDNSDDSKDGPRKKVKTNSDVPLRT